MGRRKIEIKAIKDDRNRSVYVFTSLSAFGGFASSLFSQLAAQAARNPVVSC